MHTVAPSVAPSASQEEEPSDIPAFLELAMASPLVDHLPLDSDLHLDSAQPVDSDSLELVDSDSEEPVDSDSLESLDLMVSPQLEILSLLDSPPEVDLAPLVLDLFPLLVEEFSELDSDSEELEFKLELPL